MRPPEASESTLYFVICEALTNVVRHAEASRAAVKVRIENGTVIAQVTDDGRGGACFAAGTGLAGLRDRIETLRGDLVLASEPGQGTTLTVRVPCA